MCALAMVGGAMADGERTDGSTSVSTRGNGVAPPAPLAVGVEIMGTGRATPDAVWRNDKLKEFMDTSDEWIRQRTGIVERRVSDPAKGETTRTLSVRALRGAIADAGIDANELDLVILATVTGEQTCPAVACRVAAEVGATGAGAFDLLAACSGFVYGINLAHDLIRGGGYRTVAVVGCDAMSRLVDFRDRSTGILFGDAAGAAILRRTGDASRGVVCQAMHANGEEWADLYVPHDEYDLAAGESFEEGPPPGRLRMEGRKVYKFAVGTFPKLIESTLNRAGVAASDVDYFICHQSNARMLESARERIGVEPARLPINIDRYGNCSGGSVPVVLDELRESGALRGGELVMFVAFGGGMTWASSLWRL